MVKKQESDYIKNKIKGKSWKDKKYVNYIKELRRIEFHIKYGVHGMASGIQFSTLKSKHEKEYLAILKEINPKEYKWEMGTKKVERKKELEETKKEREKEKEEEKREKKRWIELGGTE